MVRLQLHLKVFELRTTLVFFVNNKVLYCIARKFGGDLNLAVGVETTILKSTNIILAAPAIHKT